MNKSYKLLAKQQIQRNAFQQCCEQNVVYKYTGNNLLHIPI